MKNHYYMIVSIALFFSNGNSRPVRPHSSLVTREEDAFAEVIEELSKYTENETSFHLVVPEPPMQKFSTFNFTMWDSHFELSRGNDTWFIRFSDLLHLTTYWLPAFKITSGVGSPALCQEVSDEFHTRIAFPAYRCFKDALKEAKEDGAKLVSFKICFMESAGLTCGLGNGPPPCKLPKLDTPACSANDENAAGISNQQEGADKQGDADSIQTDAETTHSDINMENVICFFAQKRISELETMQRPKHH
jgi:hypothetical protein